MVVFELRGHGGQLGERRDQPQQPPPAAGGPQGPRGPSPVCAPEPCTEAPKGLAIFFSHFPYHLSYPFFMVQSSEQVGFKVSSIFHSQGNQGDHGAAAQVPMA